MRLDEAFDNLVDYCAELSPRLAALANEYEANQFRLPMAGSDIWIPVVVQKYVTEPAGLTRQHYVPFYDAAWELCRIGMLRPGPQASMGKIVPGEGGRYTVDGYSITEFGREWLADPERRANGDPSRWAEIFSSYESKYGSGFKQRAIEAVLCYRTRNHLAACAMAGAAAESILLAVAIAKKGGDEAEVLTVYSGRNGRWCVTEQVLNGVKASTANPFEAGLKSLHYWRDEAAHGKATTISDVESWASLIQLLQLARLCSDRWAELTTTVKN